MFSLEVVSIASIKEVQQNFLAVGIELTSKEMQQLTVYQKKVLQQFFWVELDPLRLSKIMNAFLASTHLHRANLLEVLKHAILIYITLRSEFDVSLTDDELCAMLVDEFVKQLNLGRAFKAADLRKQIFKLGVPKRKLRWEDDLRTTL